MQLVADLGNAVGEAATTVVDGFTNEGNLPDTAGEPKEVLRGHMYLGQGWQLEVGRVLSRQPGLTEASFLLNCPICGS